MFNKHKPIIKSYKGSQKQAQKQFLKDSERLAKKNYFPTSERWEQGKWGCGSFLIALLLCLVLIGIIVFIYMFLVSPPGTLTVTYTYKSPEQIVSTKEKLCPQCAETIKEAALICRFCGYKFEN